MVDAAGDDVCCRRSAYLAGEEADELFFAQRGRFSQLGEGKWGADVLFDVTERSLDAVAGDFVTLSSILEEQGKEHQQHSFDLILGGEGETREALFGGYEIVGGLVSVGFGMRKLQFGIIASDINEELAAHFIGFHLKRHIEMIEEVMK